MNACVDNGFAYLFYLTGVRKSLSVSASLLVFADTAHRLYSRWAMVIQSAVSIAVVSGIKLIFISFSYCGPNDVAINAIFLFYKHLFSILLSFR